MRERVRVPQKVADLASSGRWSCQDIDISSQGVFHGSFELNARGVRRCFPDCVVENQATCSTVEPGSKCHCLRVPHEKHGAIHAACSYSFQKTWHDDEESHA